MSSILFTDADGTWRLHNGKPWPASRLSGWTPDSQPFGDSAAALANGARTMLRLRDDFGVAFELAMIPAARSSNLLLRSEELDNAAWGASNVTVVANTFSAPDGSLVAEKIRENGATAEHLILQGVSGLTDNAVYVVAASLFPVERTWALLQLNGKDNVSRYAYLNLSSGAFGATSGLTLSASRYEGRGWHRFWIAATVASGGTTPSVRLGPAQADGVGSYTGVVDSGIDATWLQLEGYAQRYTPSPYLLTTSAARGGVSMTEIADRLRYHLLNGGTCTVYTNDAALSSYATCGLKPGTVPQLSLSDRRAMEYTLSLQLINLAGSPTRMLAHYAEQ